jgi:hypothetical protein
MNAAERLLNHYDRLAGAESTFVCVSSPEDSLGMYVAVYRGFPEPGAVTGFTVGLSHFHPPDGGHKELTLSMRDTDDAWALACGFVAYQLRERCPFVCGHTVNFRAQIAPTSDMSAFLVVHPLWIEARDAVVDLGVRRVEIAQLIPLYEQERARLNNGGEVQSFLQAYDSSTLLNPRRHRWVEA